MTQLCWPPVRPSIVGWEFLAKICPGVIGSGSFVGWYNGHPDSQPPAVGDVRSAVVIGNGNVAIDVARILAKGPDEVTGSDLSPEVMSWLTAQPIESIHIVGRRSAADTKFNHNELAELGTLQRARPVIADPAGLVGDSAVLTTFRGFAEGSFAPDSGHHQFSLQPDSDRICR